MSDVAQQHRDFAAGFTARVRGVTDWDAPTPVPQWRARDVVAHLIDWSTGFLAGGGVVLDGGPSPSEDPEAAWAHHAAAVQALLEDPARADAPFEHPRVPPGQSVGATLANFYVPDVFMHTWDLARASGQDDRLDTAVVEEMYAGMSAAEDMIRASGQFGQRQPVADDAPVQDRFIALIGRDPHWRPPT